MKRTSCLTALTLCAALIVGTISAYADTTDDGRLVNGRALGSSWGTVIDPLTVPNTFKSETGHGKYEYTVAVSGIYTIELWGEAGTDNSATTVTGRNGDVHFGGKAGKGGYISGTTKLKKGDILYFDLGTTAPGGYGGSGGGSGEKVIPGKSGGAASTLFIGGTQSDDRVLVAGGGAGGGGIGYNGLDKGSFSGYTIYDGANGGVGGAICPTGNMAPKGVGAGGGGPEGYYKNYWGGDYGQHHDGVVEFPGNPGGTGGPNGTGGSSGQGGYNYVNTTIFTDHSSVPGESQSCKLKITLSTGGGMDTEDVQKILDEIGHVKGQISSLDSTVATKGDVTDISQNLTSTKDQVTALQTSMGGINALLLDIQKQMANEKKAVTIVKDKPFDIFLFRVDNMDEASNITTSNYKIDLINTVPQDGIVELKGVVHTAGYVTVTFADGSTFIINSIQEPDSGNVEVIFH